MTKENQFLNLNNININEYREKKGRFDYLSWAIALREIKKVYPNTTFEVIKYDGLPYCKTETGYFVEVAVTVNDLVQSQIHPVLDNANRPLAKPNCFQINTSIQRCLAKAIALHGLGLSLFAGEDLEQYDQPTQPEQKIQPEQYNKTQTPQKQTKQVYSNNSEKLASVKQLAVLDKNNVDYNKETITNSQADSIIKKLIARTYVHEPIAKKEEPKTFNFEAIQALSSDETPTNSVTLESVLDFISSKPASELKDSVQLSTMIENLSDSDQSEAIQALSSKR
jgi:hypothetical protein